MNEIRPHGAVIWIEAKVHQKLPDGHYGDVVETISKFPLAIDGESRADVTRRLNEVLGELKTRCRTHS